VTDLKSEYHRRVREKAEQHERDAERERKKAAEQANIEKVIRSIDGVSEKLDRQADENTPEKKSGRKWQRAEVIGLWAAAAVGVIAIYVASSDSDHQRVEMHGQLEAMKGQLAAMQAQNRPWIKGEFKLGQLSRNENGHLNAEIDVRFINTGNYPAQVVWVGGAVYPNPQLHWQAVQTGLCRNTIDAWQNILKNPTNIALPNEPSPWSRQFTFTPNTEISAWQNMVLTENGAKALDPKPPWVFKVPLVFIGCITYSASNPLDVHQTGFMLDFATGVSPAGGPLDATFDVSGSGPREYDISGVTLIQGFRGAFGN
jgi:hypothetical protein